MPVAMVVLWTTLSLTSRPTPPISRLTTHTLLELPFSAKKPHTKAKSPLRASLMSKQTAKNNWLLLFKNNQSLLPSKPTNVPSNCTKAVFSMIDAELTLTMVLLLLVMVLKMPLNTSSSETHGEHHGVSKVISELLVMTPSQKVSAVLPCKLHTQKYELLK